MSINCIYRRWIDYFSQRLKLKDIRICTGHKQLIPQSCYEPVPQHNEVHHLSSVFNGIKVSHQFLPPDVHINQPTSGRDDPHMPRLSADYFPDRYGIEGSRKWI